MPVNKKYLANFEYEGIYHIYNKTNNRELLFRSDENYFYFLNLFTFYMTAFVEIYAWTLLPNHFHFLIRIKPEKKITQYLRGLPLESQTKSQKKYLVDNNINVLIEMEFKRYFISYAMSFNTMYGRSGNLFYRTFKRVEINKDDQFTQVLIYIHANAQKHKMVKRFDKYKWTSFHTIISKTETELLRNEILEWFGGKENFINTHFGLSKYYYSITGCLEEDDYM